MIRQYAMIVLVLFFMGTILSVSAQERPKVLFKTNMGDIELELDQEKAPISVENFLSYVSEGFYTDVIFHRVIPKFMIQGGGFTKEMKRKEVKDPIKNEAKNGLKNERGTICYARTNIVDSATSEFFINLVDNTFLDHGVRDYGYAVFGKVTKGMDVLDKIGKVKTKTLSNGMGDVPVKPIIILSAEILNGKTDKE